MPNHFSKTFFLTGSARGLGLSLSTAILEAGHRLIATARRPEHLTDLISRFGERMLPLQLDVTNFEAARSAMLRGTEVFGKVDVVINNAGRGTVGSVEDLPTAAFVEQMTTNFMGAVHVIKAALPVLRRQGGGRIILVSSIGDRIATPGAAAYYASKWATAGFADSLAREAEPLGIKVTVVEPGGMKTDFAEDSSLRIIPSNAAYDATVGATAKMLKSAGYSATLGDPAKVASVIMKVAELDQPPTRLLIGSGTLQYGASADQVRSEADKTWAWLSALGD